MEVTKLLVVAPNYNVVCCCTFTDNVLYTIDSAIEPPEILGSFSASNGYCIAGKFQGIKFLRKGNIQLFLRIDVPKVFHPQIH